MWLDKVLSNALIAILAGLLGFLIILVVDFLARFFIRLSQEPINLKSNYTSLGGIASLLAFVLTFIATNVLWSAPWMVRAATAGVILGAIYLQGQRLKSLLKAAGEFIMVNKPLLSGILAICALLIIFTAVLHLSPIEGTFWAIITLFAIIGLIRGWSKEVGTTTGLVLAMFILSCFGERMISSINRVFEAIGIKQLIIADAPSASRFLFFALVFLAVAFISYRGGTLGKKVSGITGHLLGLFTGLINGYLIAGNLWFYLHEQQYLPLQRVFKVPTSQTALVIIRLLPPKILTEQILFVLLIFLPLLRIIK